MGCASVRARAWVGGGEFCVVHYGLLGKQSRYLLSDMQNVESGATLNGECVLQFTYRGKLVRLGPWWGFRRRTLAERVIALTLLLSQATSAARGEPGTWRA